LASFSADSGCTLPPLDNSGTKYGRAFRFVDIDGDSEPELICTGDTGAGLIANIYDRQ
jgi:hypothetical protein